MSFLSMKFLLFLVAAVAGYYVIPRQLQWVWLLIFSYIFYLASGPAAVVFILTTTATTFLGGLWLEHTDRALACALDRTLARDPDRLRRPANPQQPLSPDEKKALKERFKQRKKWIAALVLLINFGILAALKYRNFAADNMNLLFGTHFSSAKLLLPLGISFYTFQSMGYLIDVYRGKYAPDRNPFRFALFVSFFPQMVQGPISRFNDLAPQLFARRSLDYTDLKYGIQLILWGYFKKMVIADRAAVLVNTVLDDPWSYSGSILAVGVLFYCIQLYGDFSGGIDITRGVARLFGIDLAENFRRPLFSTSLTDFWRRWHITLGAWMRDYLFYPLSLSKPFGKLGKFTRKHLKGKLGKILPTSLATFLVYFVIGIWHGANWRYVAFGFWNGGIITLSLLLAPYFLRWKQALRINDKSKGWHLFQLVRTNLLVFFGRYITRAPRFLTAVWMVKETFLHPNLPDLWNGTLMTLGLGGGDFLILFLGVATLLLAEWYQEKKGPIRPMLERQSPFLQWVAILVPLVVLFCFGVLRADYISSDFIYKQF